MPKRLNHVKTSLTPTDMAKARTAMNNARKWVAPEHRFTEPKIERIAKELLEYMAAPDVIYYANFLVKQGITWSSLAFLRLKHPILNEAIELADMILEERYVSGGLNKTQAGKHCQFLLTHFIGGKYRKEPIIQMNVQDASIFEGAKPAIEVVEIGQSQNAMQIDMTSKVFAMGPNEAQGASTANRMDVNDMIDIASPPQK